MSEFELMKRNERYNNNLSHYKRKKVQLQPPSGKVSHQLRAQTLLNDLRPNVYESNTLDMILEVQAQPLYMSHS